MKKVFTTILSILFWMLLIMPLMWLVFFSDGVPVGMRVWAILAFVVVSCIIQFKVEDWVKTVMSKQD